MGIKCRVFSSVGCVALALRVRVVRPTPRRLVLIASSSRWIWSWRLSCYAVSRHNCGEVRGREMFHIRSDGFALLICCGLSLVRHIGILHRWALRISLRGVRRGPIFLSIMRAQGMCGLRILVASQFLEFAHVDWSPCRF